MNTQAGQGLGDATAPQASEVEATDASARVAVTLPKPYYEDELTTIYHGDCREILPLVDFDCIVSDPPYGIAIVQGGTVGGTKSAVARKYLSVAGDEEPFDPEWLLKFGVPTILWGGNHFGGKLPSASKWLVWDKRNGGKSDNFADCELAWTNIGGPARLYHHLWRGMIAKTTHSDGDRQHPTQKPSALMNWCLEMVEGAVVDPYMGSGTTLRAAKDLGRKAIGIEIEEKYCEIAANRCSQEVMNFGEAA